MIYLVSQSPRRAGLLQQIGVPFQTLWCEIDETPIDQESPDDYVLRMAHEKSGAGWEK
ncbi:MAG: Maf family protein, partial [Endozoicomonas sp.]